MSFVQEKRFLCFFHCRYKPNCPISKRCYHWLSCNINTSYGWFIFQLLIHYFLLFFFSSDKQSGRIPWMEDQHTTRPPSSPYNKKTTEIYTHPCTLLQIFELFVAIGALLKLSGNGNRIQHWNWPHSVSLGRANLVVECFCGLCSVGRDRVVGSGDRISIGPIFSEPFQTGPTVHPASCTMVTGSLARGNAAWTW